MSDVLPRLVRFRDGAHYLGMDKNRFNREVRPFLTEIRIGIQGIAFDRFELDAWVDDYKRSNGRPARKELLCERDTDLASACGEATGTSTKSSAADAFAKHWLPS